MKNSLDLNTIEGYREAVDAVASEAELANIVEAANFAMPEIEQAYLSALQERRQVKEAALANPSLQEGVASYAETALRGLEQINEYRRITGSDTLKEVEERLRCNIVEVAHFFDTFGATTEQSIALQARLRSMGELTVVQEAEVILNNPDDAYPDSVEVPAVKAPESSDDVADNDQIEPEALSEPSSPFARTPDVEASDLRDDGEREMPESALPDEGVAANDLIRGPIKIGKDGVVLLHNEDYIPYAHAKAVYRSGVNTAERVEHIKRYTVLILSGQPGEFMSPREIADKIEALSGRPLKLERRDTSGLKDWLFAEVMSTSEGLPIFVQNGKVGRGAKWAWNPAVSVAKNEAESDVSSGEPEGTEKQEPEVKEELPKPFVDAYDPQISGVKLETYNVPHTPLGDAYVAACTLLSSNTRIEQALKDLGFELAFNNPLLYKNELKRYRPDRAMLGGDNGKLLQYRIQAGQNLEALLTASENGEDFIRSLESMRILEFMQQLQSLVGRNPGSQIISRLLNSEWKRMGDRVLLVYEGSGITEVIWPASYAARTGEFDSTNGEIKYTGAENRSQDRKNTVRRQKIEEIAKVAEDVTSIFIEKLGNADESFDIATIKPHISKFSASAVKRVLKRAVPGASSATYSAKEVANVLILDDRRLGALYKSQFASHRDIIERVVEQAIARAKQKASVPTATQNS